MMDFDTILDTAANRLIGGEPLPSILADDPANAESLGPLLSVAASLDGALPVQLPAPNQFQADRDAFLAQVQFLQQQPVPVPLPVRLKEWIVGIFPGLFSNRTYSGKEHPRMSSLLIKAMLVFGLVLGTTGGTAVMAANSLPDSPLFPLKLSMEQARLMVAGDPAEQAQLRLEMAQVRAQEMTQLALQGDVPDEAVQTRLQQQLNLALQLAAGLDNGQMLGVLTQARAMVQAQTQQMTQAQAQVGEPAQSALQQATRAMQQFGRDVETGLADPLAFRNRFGFGRPADAPEPLSPEPQQKQQVGPPEEAPAVGPGPNEDPTGPKCPAGDCEPVRTRQQSSQGDELPAGAQNQHQYGQDAEKPANPDCPGGDCEPVGDANKYGQGDTTGGPHGDQDCTSDCEPAGDENKYGQDEDNSGGPHGDQDCTSDCEPVGDENKYGQDDDTGGPNGDSAEEPAQQQNKEQEQSTQQAEPAPQPQPEPQPAPDNSGSSDSGGSSNSGGSSDSGGGGGGKK